MLRTSRFHASYRRLFVNPAARACLRLGFSSFQISMISFALAVTACVLLSYKPLWGGFIVLLSGFMDTLDGEMARTSGRQGRAGAFLDSILDRYSDFLFIFGTLLYYYRSDALTMAGVLLFLWLAFGTLMGNYAQARAEGLNDSCSVGLWERPEIILFLGGCLILNGLIPIEWCDGPGVFRPGAILGVALIVLALGTNWVALRRLVYGYKRMRGAENGKAGG